MTKYELNIDSLKNKLLKSVVPVVKWIVDELYLEIQINSPVDTWTYLSQHRNEWVTVENGMVVWRVSNEWDYSEKVEFGWRKTAVNWHLKNWTIYVSKWAETYEKSLLKIKKKFIDKLK